jgi:hypothetical protein
MTHISRRGLLRLSAALPASSLAARLGWPQAIAGGSLPDSLVLIEAESFASAGGWVLDQQFTDRMGSCMLLAHGMGAPVADATTEIAIAMAGKYRVWVRTRDWAAQWGAKSAPGRFQVAVNGEPLVPVFGTEGGRWHWQDGGIVQLAAGKARLALHDLTGFDGRCDAILLSGDPTWRPPDEGPELAALRRHALKLPAEPEDAGEFDLVVAGGGMAGCAASVAAARLGLKVALIQDRPVLGGNSSSEIRVSPVGNIHLPPYPALGQVVADLDPSHPGNGQIAANYGDQRKRAVVEAEKNIQLHLDMHIFAVERDGNRITAVVARDENTSRELRFRAPLFADCTGDATVGYLAGADFRYGRESRAETGESLAPESPDRLVNGATILWYTEEAGVPTAFPETPWALQFTDATAQNATRGDWDWETGQLRDQIADFETVRDHALRAIYGNWSFQKNHAADRQKYANLRLAWVGYVGGKRESRRLLGDVILHQQDVMEQRPYTDATFTTTWPIDLHEPTQKNAADFPGQEFRAICHQTRIASYAIPYRCLYSRNVQNLFMAGRNCSATHVALGTVRVQRTTGMMGEVVGMAAAIAHQRNTTPRGVYENYLPELKAAMTRGAGLTALAPPPKSSVPAGYALAWQDEFDGATLDTAAWAYRTDSKEWSMQLPQNVSVGDGNLTLHLTRMAPGAAMKYAGAGVISRQAFSYGYFESRMRIMAGKGWHSSFWLMRHDGSGGTSPVAAKLELDIVENDAVDLRSYGITTHRWKDRHEAFGHRQVEALPLTDYHVYGCEYTPEMVHYFFDGELMQSVDIRALPQGELNIWLTSIASHLGPTDAVDTGRLPCHVDYDYVRYYRKS